MTWLEKLDEFPPIICRLLARREITANHKIVPLTITEIAENSGLPIGLVKWIAVQKSWKRVRTEHVDPFMKGCGMSYGNLWIHRRFLRYQYKQKIPLSYIEKLDPRLRVALEKQMS